MFARVPLKTSREMSTSASITSLPLWEAKQKRKNNVSVFYSTTFSFETPLRRTIIAQVICKKKCHCCRKNVFIE